MTGDHSCPAWSYPGGLGHFAYTPFENSFDAGPATGWMREHQLWSAYAALGYVFAVGLWHAARQPTLALPPWIRVAWNIGLALFSAIGFTRLAPALVHTLWADGLAHTVCDEEAKGLLTQGAAGLWAMLFVWSKLLEFGDTALLLSAGKRPSALHLWHHPSAMLLAWNECVQQSPTSAWLATMNFGVHAGMYSYFGLADLFPEIRHSRVPLIITLAQCAQMAIAIALVGLAGWLKKLSGVSCAVSDSSLLATGLVYTSYLYLFGTFADQRYGIISRLRALLLSQGSAGPPQPWLEPGLSVTRQFEVAAAMLPGMALYISTDDAAYLYGHYKQAKLGDQKAEAPPAAQTRQMLKWRGWCQAAGLSKTDAMQRYVKRVHQISTRAAEKLASSDADGASAIVLQRAANAPSFCYHTRIAGVGRYLPRKVVTNADLEKRFGWDPGSTDRVQSGVTQRHMADPNCGESQPEMAAHAVREAVLSANMTLEQIDCIINASGTYHQSLPDGSPLLQRALGLSQSGITCFSVSSTCLSFVTAMDLAGALITTGRFKAVVISSSEMTHHGLDPNDMHSAVLFGDAAAAVVVVPSGAHEESAIVRVEIETFSEGADLCEIRGGGNRRLPNEHAGLGQGGQTQTEDQYLSMHPSMMEFAGKHLEHYLERLLPGLSKGLHDLQWVVPHQASGAGLSSLQALGWPKEKIITTIEGFGNCVAASIPLTLYEGVKQGKIKRGDKVLLCGTSAGVSFGGLILKY